MASTSLLVDSGSDITLIRDASLLWDYVALQRPVFISTANGSKLPIRGVGTIRGLCETLTGKQRLIDIKEVYYAPGVVENLLSL